MKEKAQSRLDVMDLDYETVFEMVRFIYTDDAPKIDEMAENILIAADKYALDGLKVMYEGVLCSGLSVETQTQFLTPAGIYSTDHLKAHAVSFVATHATRVVVEQLVCKLRR